MAKEHSEMQPNLGWLKKSYRGLVKTERFIGHFLLLIIRLYWGGQLVLTGLGKWLNIHDVALYFKSLGIPAPLFSASFIATLELIGGMLLFFGLFSRLITILLSALFITAYATAHKAIFAHFFSHPSLFTTQEPFLFLYASLVVLCFGPGLFSFDYWIEKRSFGSSL